MAERTQQMSTQIPQASQRSIGASTTRVTLPAAGFALDALFERIPDARIELEPAIANAADHSMIVVRTDDAERGVVETAIESDRGVAAAECLTERDDGWTYRVTWKGHPHDLVQRLVAAGVTMLSMRGRDGQWKLRLLAANREGISRAHDIMTDLNCGAECRSISTFDGSESNGSKLTDEQREALTAAFEAGYYEIPRNVTADELADDLGISHQALSERFRRAYQHMVEDELVVDETHA